MKRGLGVRRARGAGSMCARRFFGGSKRNLTKRLKSREGDRIEPSQPIERTVVRTVVARLRATRRAEPPSSNRRRVGARIFVRRAHRWRHGVSIRRARGRATRASNARRDPRVPLRPLEVGTRFDRARASLALAPRPTRGPDARPRPRGGHIVQPTIRGPCPTRSRPSRTFLSPLPPRVPAPRPPRSRWRALSAAHVSLAPRAAPGAPPASRARALRRSRRLADGIPRTRGARPASSATPRRPPARRPRPPPPRRPVPGRVGRASAGPRAPRHANAVGRERGILRRGRGTSESEWEEGWPRRRRRHRRGRGVSRVVDRNGANGAMAPAEPAEVFAAVSAEASRRLRGPENPGRRARRRGPPPPPRRRRRRE